MPAASNQRLRPWSPAGFVADPQPTLFQKVLLATDGTVTELLALHTGQPIRARKLAQTLGEVAAPAALGCTADAPVLHRTVILEPVHGGDRVFAESFFVFGRFSASMQRSLVETEEPIGLLWRLERLEMFREVIERGVLVAPDVAARLQVPADTELFTRTYSIAHGGRTLGLITETFASTAYR